ncbi:hypothetical protein ACS0TY_024629 [Phlomoides rotata]
MFDEISQPCIVSYNALLDAFGKSGNMGLAIPMFLNMPKRDVYSWTGQNGCFREAISFFREMMADEDVACGFLRPNEATFVSVLSACANLDDGIALSQANEVGRQLLKKRPNHCGQYVLLSSIYAGAEIWDHAAALRKAMAHAGIQKIPAFSMAD